jgi:hypothetical protein
MMLAFGAVLVAALAARLAGRDAVTLRRLALVGGVAFGVRLVAITIIYLIAIRTHPEGTWLNDEASFYLAAESLLPNPWNAPLPQGLDHLGGNGYLGMLTAIALALGQMDTVAFRLANAALGAMVALLTTAVATRLFGVRTALVAGLAVALWPTEVLWSATFLRDTVCSFVVVAVWWTLMSHARLGSIRIGAVLVLALALLASLRPYLAGAVGLGVLAWGLFPLLAAQSRRVLLILSAAVVAGTALIAMVESRQIDEAAHALVYRQTTTRLETLGRLYYELNPNAPPPERPFTPGIAVAKVNQQTGWLLTGLIQEPLGPGMVLVTYTDETVQPERTADLMLLQSAPLSPFQIAASIGWGLLSFLSGATTGTDSSSLVWTVDALAWDILLALAIIGTIRARIATREWLYPAVVVLGTVCALAGVPGAPGNDDRHRVAQALPLLTVFAVGVIASWPTRARAGRPVSTEPSSATSASTLAPSRMCSLR